MRGDRFYVARASRPCSPHAAAMPLTWARRPCHVMRRSGFTLIEISVVAFLMALLSAGVMVSFSRPLRAARQAEAVDMVRSFDATARLVASRSGRPVLMQFDSRAGAMLRYDGVQSLDDDRDERSPTQRVTLPGGFSIDRFRRIDDASEDTVHCAPPGLTPTYALRLKGPDATQWLLFTGLSGQFLTTTDDSQIDDIFRAAGGRPLDE